MIVVIFILAVILVIRLDLKHLFDGNSSSFVKHTNKSANRSKRGDLDRHKRHVAVG